MSMIKTIGIQFLLSYATARSLLEEGCVRELDPVPDPDDPVSAPLRILVVVPRGMSPRVYIETTNQFGDTGWEFAHAVTHGGGEMPSEWIVGAVLAHLTGLANSEHLVHDAFVSETAVKYLVLGAV